MKLQSINKELRNGINLNIIETDMFKSNLISFYFVRPLLTEEATMNALLPLVLKRGTKKYENNLKIQRKLEEMYGADLGVSVSKRGERQVVKFTIEWIDDSFVRDKDYVYEVIDMIREIIYNPVLEGDAFKKEYVAQEKENLRRRIEGKINNKRGYAIDRCIEEMCKNERYSVSGLGSLEELADIDERKLYRHYREFVESSPMEIVYVGRKNKRIIEYMEERLDIHRSSLVEIPRESIDYEYTTKNMIHEELDVNQGKLVLGYRSNVAFEDKLYPGLVMTSELLGGNTNSKLFKNVREKESLAYYAASTLIKYKSILIVDSGIEFESYDKALKIIIEQLEEIKKGKFTDEDIDISKKSIISSYKSVYDNIHLISEFFFGKTLSRDERTIDQMMDDILRVTRDDIVKASNTISLDTIYFMKSTKKTKED